MRQQPGPATASNASCPITNIAPALKYKQMQSETAPVGIADSKPPPASLQVIADVPTLAYAPRTAREMDNTMDDTMLSIARAALSCGRRQDGHDVSLVSCRINIDLRLPPPFSPSPILLRWRCQVASTNAHGPPPRNQATTLSPLRLHLSTTRCNPKPPL